MLDIRLCKQLESFNLNLSFKTMGGVTALFGPSGSGKSMTAKMLGGLEAPDAGHIRLNERELFAKEDQKAPTTDLPTYKRKIGYVFQDHRLFPHYTVLGNLKYGMSANTQSGTTINLDEVIHFLGIKDLLNRKPASLSGGEQQRVALGRALLNRPELLIMDEPLSSLDQGRKGEILTLIEKMRDQFGQQILYISHSIDEVMRLANDLILIDKGSLLAHGPVAEILSRQDLFPFTGGIDAGAVLETTVANHDTRLNLTTLSSKAGPVTVPLLSACPIGDAVRIRIRARDVALSITDISDISILNRFNGKIMDIIDEGPGMATVLIDAGIPIAARVTKKSVQQLQLVSGKTVWALVKSVTVNSVEFHPF